MSLKSIFDPMSLEIQPGFQVRDLTTPEECASALLRLDDEMASIRHQIAVAEERPAAAYPGWRMKAQNALSMKKRIARAIRTYASTMAATRPGINEKRQAILDTIKRELGDAEFDRLVALAKDRSPHLPWAS